MIMSNNADLSCANKAKQSDKNKRIAKNSIFMSIRMVFLLLLTLYTTRVTLKALGVEDFGVYNVVYGFVSLFSFLNLSLTNGIQRFYNFELGKNGIYGANCVFNTAALIQIALVLIIVLIVEFSGIWYINNKLVVAFDRLYAAKLIFHCSVFSFALLILQAPFSAAVMAHERMDFYAFASILSGILNLAAAISINFLNGDKLILYALLLSLSNLAVLATYIIYCKTRFQEIKLSKNIDLALLSSMLRFSGWNFLGSMSGVLKEQGVNLILNLYFGPVVNAARGVATQVCSGLQSFVNNISVPARPQVIQSYASGDTQRTINLTLSISKLSCLFLYMISIPILFEIDFVLKLWLGDNVPDYTSGFVVIVVLTSFINNLNAAVSGVVHATGKMKNYQLIGATINLFTLPIAYIFLELGYSAYSAIVIIFIITGINQYASLLVLKSLIVFSLTEYLQKVILPLTKIVATTIWIPCGISVLLSDGFPRLLINAAISIIVICTAIYCFGLSISEKRVANQFIKETTKRFRNGK